MPLGRYLLAVLAVGLLSALNTAISPWVGASTVALIYFVAILLLSFVLSQGATVLMAVLAAMSWNYLFLAPVHTLHIERLEDAITFAVFLTFALVAGNLTGKLRAQAEAVRMREARLSTLYDFATRMNRIFGAREILEAGVQDLERISGKEAAVFLLEKNHLVQAAPREPRILSDEDRLRAMSAVQNGLASLDSVNRLLFVPLRMHTGSAGIVVARFADKVETERETLIETMASQLAALLDRENLLKLTQDARTNEEIDRLYKALLNLLTHEIRTPIAVIQGSVSSLLGGLVSRPEETRKLLAEADLALSRLNRLIENLLDMSKIEAGKLKLNLDWHDPVEILRMVVSQVEREFPDRNRTQISAAASLLLRIDFTLVEKAFYNVIRNAYLHNPAGVQVRVSVKTAENQLCVAIEDNGPGLSDETERSLFTKFSRGSDSGEGIGIGLSVVKGILEAHGATIGCERILPHGTQFLIRFPVTAQNARPFEISA